MFVKLTFFAIWENVAQKIFKQLIFYKQSKTKKKS